MSKVRVYEVAKQLNVDQKLLVQIIQSMGLTDVKNHMSAVDGDVVDRVKRHLEKQKSPAVVEERIRPTVVKRRAAPRAEGVTIPEPAPSVRVDVPPAPPSAQHAAPASEPEPAPRIEIPPPRVSERTTRVAEIPPPRESARVERVSGRVEMIPEPPPPPSPPPPPPREERVDVEATVVAEPHELPGAAYPSPPPPAAEVAPVPDATMAQVEDVKPTTSRASVAPKTGIDVWAGRPGVPMPPPPAPRSTTPVARRVEYNMRGSTGPGVRPGQTVRGGAQASRPGQMGGMRGGVQGRGRPGGPQIRRGPAAVSTKEMGADKKVIKIEEKINLQTLAARMSLKATEVLMKLMSMGMQGAHINSSLDADDAKLVAGEFGWEVEDVAVSEEAQLNIARGEEPIDAAVIDEDSELRPPIVTVMGHVDHGKTSLLDQIRKTNVAGGEAGGITQHIGAYRVQTAKGPITFLDTPGHEAFTAMRARGASLTDIVVLVVAADDGVMPQTREAANHARAAKVPIIVAINKVDKPEANPERVKRQLMDLGLLSEDLGGDTIYVEVSAKTRLGVDHLLEMLALQAEIMELRANPKKPAHGVVVEALLDRGKGPVARVIITDGTLRTGDFLLSGPAVGKVRAMTDEAGRSVTVAGPSTPVEILGLTDVPNAGDTFDAVKDAKKAQEIAESRRVKAKQSMPATSKVTLEDLAMRASQAEQVELRVIVKADVQGSVEALSEALSRLTSPKVRLSIINASVGAITEGDVNLAIASRALIIGFSVRPAGKSAALAESEGIEIRQYSIIYNVIDDIRSAMEGLLAPSLVEKEIGKVEVRAVFKLSKAGLVAGSMVIAGVVKRGAKVRARREGEVVFEGKITGLKRFKDDVRDVAEGFECGVSIEGFEGVKEGDILEIIEVEEVRQRL